MVIKMLEKYLDDYVNQLYYRENIGLSFEQVGLYSKSEYYNLLSKWFRNKLQHIEISDYLRRLEVKNVGIYGIGNIGELLYRDLVNTTIRIPYVVDRGIFKEYVLIEGRRVSLINQLEMLRDMETVDCMIITPYLEFQTIRDELRDLGVTSKIFSIEDCIYESSR